MFKLTNLAVLMFVFALICTPAMVLAQDANAPAAPAAEQTAVQENAAPAPISLSTIGAGLIIIGAAYGIGKIGGNAVESMARQPETAGAIQTAMIISAALIEGVTFFALIICLMK